MSHLHTAFSFPSPKPASAYVPAETGPGFPSLHEGWVLLVFTSFTRGPGSRGPPVLVSSALGAVLTPPESGYLGTGPLLSACVCTRCFPS